MKRKRTKTKRVKIRVTYESQSEAEFTVPADWKLDGYESINEDMWQELDAGIVEHSATDWSAEDVETEEGEA